MKRKFIGMAAASLLAISAFGATSASAATEVGSNCMGDRAEVLNSTLVQLSSTTSPSSASIPVAGVITKWRVNVISYPGGISEKLKVLRPAGGNNFTTVGESTVQPIVSGQNTFETRIPVQAGDHLGGHSALAMIYCSESASATDVIGATPGDTGTGSTSSFPEATEGVLALSATVEPDADNDGYGDETQDKCPTNASFQTPCPVITLSASSVAKKGLATVLVTSNLQAQVNVSGTVKLGKGKTAKLTGGTQVVTPGVIAKFTMLFPQNLKAKLKELLRKRFLTLNISATAPNVVGPPTVSSLSAKLRGQKKPPRKGKGKAKGQKPKGNG